MYVMNWFTLEQRWGLFGQRETAWWYRFCQKKKIIFLFLILLTTLISKNFNIRSSEKPQKSMQPLRVTIGCEWWSEGIIGPYFFENKNTTFNEESWHGILWTKFGCTRMVQHARHLMPQSIYCVKRLMAV